MGKKDFADKPRATNKNKMRGSKPSIWAKPAYVYTALTIAVGVFAAFLFYLNKLPDSNSKQDKQFAHPQNKSGRQNLVEHPLKLKAQEAKPKTQKKVVKATPKPRPKATPKKEPEFQFYDMLQDAKVEIAEPVAPKKPKVSPNKSPETIAKPSGQTKGATRYQLQVGAFQSVDKADGMKARLALQGIESKITIVWTQDKRKMYRVIAGPWNDEVRLNKARARLQQQNINTIVQAIR